MADFFNLSVLVQTGLYVGFLVLVMFSSGFLKNHALCTGCELAFL